MAVMKTNGLKAWVLASRPKTLTGAIAPVLVGATLAYTDTSHLDLQAWSLGLLCLFFAIIMQIDANLVNDYFDFKKGTDREDRLGPERACAQGWITPQAMRWGIGLCTLIACVVGLVMLFVSQRWELLIVGIACVVGCFLYTIKFSYIGLGDLLVLLFFGIVPVGFTYLVMTGNWTLPLTFAGIGMGLATDNLLMVNNYRDIEQDKQSGKKTIVVRMGKQAALQLYLWLGLVAAILMITVEFVLYVNEGRGWMGIPIIVVYVALHLSNYQKMRALTGKALNMVLGKTAAGIFLYAVVFAVSLLINATA
ncbi:MAG: 1,4-dihydroxy-2-naphthoate octaprenyltransferase [Bacteroidaceae bacterium]|nr:1,4-dihydroxy-2-naphthoate octaprenyltransferase [Bacteroidaceae bacterium]